MNAKNFPLRRDFAPGEARGEDTPGARLAGEAGKPEGLHIIISYYGKFLADGKAVESELTTKRQFVI